MKICIISGYPPLIGGGAESTSNFVQALNQVERISKIVVLANYANGLPNEQSSRITILRIWDYNSYISIFRIIYQVAKIRPDVVHIVYGYLFYGNPIFSAIFIFSLLFAFKVLQKRVIITTHNVFSKKSVTKDFLKKFGLFSSPFVVRVGFSTLNKVMEIFTFKVIVLCKKHMKILKEEYKMKNVIFIPIFIPLGSVELNESKYVHQTKAKQLLDVNNRKIILSFGFIAPHKGLEYVIQALPGIIEQHPDTMLIIGGSLLPRLSQSKKGKAYINKLKALVDTLGIKKHVIFAGYIAENKIPLYFKAADVVVLPYTANPGPSEVLRTAAIYGRPVVASNIDYFRQDIINGKNGLLVPPKNSQALAQAIITILTDSKLRKKLSSTIRKDAEKHSFENVIKKIVERCYLEEVS